MALESDPKFFLLHHPSWLDAEKFEKKILGSVIRDFADPAGSDYIPDNPLRHYKEDEFIESTYNDFLLNNDHSSSREASADIASLGGAKLIGTLKDKIELKGKRIHMKRLQRYPRFWDSLKEDQQVKKELPHWVGIRTLRDPVCLVVGIMVCEDVDMSSERGVHREMSLHAKVLIAETVLPGSEAILGGAPKVEGKLAAEQDDTAQLSGKFESRKIFALQLKNVTTPWLRHRKAQFNLADHGPDVPKVRLLGEDDEEEPGSSQAYRNDLVIDDMADDDFDDFLV